MEAAKHQRIAFKSLEAILAEILAAHWLVNIEALPAEPSFSELLQEAKRKALPLWALWRHRAPLIVMGLAIEQRILITLLGICFGSATHALACGAIWFTAKLIYGNLISPQIIDFRVFSALSIGFGALSLLCLILALLFRGCRRHGWLHELQGQH